MPLVSGSDLTMSRSRVRLATLDDLPFIVALALANRAVLCFEPDDAEAIACAAGGRIELPGRAGSARLTIFEEPSSSPCGFLLSIQYDNLQFGFASELYLLAVESQSKRKGVGRCLIAEAIEKLESSSRCICALARSNESAQLLTGVFGFEVVNESKQGTVLCKCGKDCSGEAAHSSVRWTH